MIMLQFCEEIRAKQSIRCGLRVSISSDVFNFFLDENKVFFLVRSRITFYGVSLDRFASADRPRDRGRLHGRDYFSPPCLSSLYLTSRVTGLGLLRGAARLVEWTVIKMNGPVVKQRGKLEGMDQ